MCSPVFTVHGTIVLGSVLMCISVKVWCCVFTSIHDTWNHSVWFSLVVVWCCVFNSHCPQPTTSTTLLPSEEPSNSATTVQSSHSDSTASLSQPITSAGAKDNFPQQDPEVELAFHSQLVSSTSGLGLLIDQIFLGEPAKSRENHATDLLDEGIPLGASVSQKLKAKLWSNEFIDLRTVLTFKEDPLSVTISSGVINLNQESKFKIPFQLVSGPMHFWFSRPSISRNIPMMPLIY